MTTNGLTSLSGRLDSAAGGATPESAPRRTRLTCGAVRRRVGPPEALPTVNSSLRRRNTRLRRPGSGGFSGLTSVDSQRTAVLERVAKHQQTFSLSYISICEDC